MPDGNKVMCKDYTEGCKVELGLTFKLDPTEMELTGTVFKSDSRFLFVI